MSTKPKKPKARRMWTDAEWQDGEGSVLWGSSMRNRHSVPVAVLDLSDPNELIDIVARIIASGDVNYPYGAAEAALTAIGVLPKRRGK